MGKTSSSWGHEIVTVAEAMSRSERASVAAVRSVIESFGGPTTPRPTEYSCSAGLRCPGRREQSYTIGQRIHTYMAGAPAAYRASYRYISGRGGNTSIRDLWLCQACGARFAQRHHLELPAASAADR